MNDFNLENLGLNNEEFADVNFDTMPTTIGSFVTPPQPGLYRFRLPSGAAMFKAITAVPTTDYGQRVEINFKDESALINVTKGNDPYHVKLNNTPRTIGKAEKAQVVSDWLMLLKALGVTPTGNNNAAHIQALLSAAGKEFLAENTLSTSCSQTRDIFKDGKVQQGRKGCGTSYRVKGYPGRNGKPDVLSIPREQNGDVALRFNCVCGASLSAWPRLQGFRAAE